MCELFGVTSREPIEVNNYLNKFVDRSDEQPHGWGIATLHGNEAILEKEATQASKSQYLGKKLSNPIIENNLFAHIRYATIGNVEKYNCHPFTYEDWTSRRWTLIHNGTIFEYKDLEDYINVQEGDTDSERILLHIIDLVNHKTMSKGAPLTAEERFNMIDTLAVKLSKGNKLNFLLYDGEYTYVHTNYQDSLHYLDKNGAVIISTKPLTDENWVNFPLYTLQVYKNGQLVFTGTNHGNEYIDNEEDMKLIYQIFSEL